MNNMPKVIAESDVEENVLAILDSLGYKILRGDNEASTWRWILSGTS